MNVLVVEDDPDILNITSYVLRRKGFIVSIALDGVSALQQIQADPPDIVLLDIQLPRMSGYDVLQNVRRQSNLPIIMLTALSFAENVVRGLQLGADDYVTKPFSPGQLIARMCAVLASTRPDLCDLPPQVEAAGMILRPDIREVTRDGCRVRMTPLECCILHILMRHAGSVMPSARLLELTWGAEGGGKAMLRSHIGHIRKKLARSPGEPGYIECVPGVGYMLQT